MKYLDKAIHHVYQKHYEVWALMAEMTPTMFDVLVNMQRSNLRVMADLVGVLRRPPALRVGSPDVDVHCGTALPHSQGLEARFATWFARAQATAANVVDAVRRSTTT